MSRSHHKQAFIIEPSRKPRHFYKNWHNRRQRRVSAEADLFPVKGQRYRYGFLNPWAIRDYRHYYSFSLFMRQRWLGDWAVVKNTDAGSEASPDGHGAWIRYRKEYLCK